MTPHQGEFQRLFGPMARDRGKLAKARAAAKISGAIIVLKGADTVIAAPDGRAAIADNAPPWLATGGLRRCPGGLCPGPFGARNGRLEAACGRRLAAWRGGSRVPGRGLIAEDLPEVLPKVRIALDRGSRPGPIWKSNGGQGDRPCYFDHPGA